MMMLHFRPISALFEAMEAHGVSYSSIFQREFARYASSHELLTNWQPEDFGTRVVDGKDALTGEAAQKLLQADAMVCVPTGFVCA